MIPRRRQRPVRCGVIPQLEGAQQSDDTLRVINEVHTPNNQYHVFRFDLSVARNVEPLGVKEFLKSRNVEFATHMVILAVPSPWFFRVNEGNAPMCAAMVGDEWEDLDT